MKFNTNNCVDIISEKDIKLDKPLRIKYGIDPTNVDIHLGHSVPLRKLKEFQELGHIPVIVIGNYTALIGDPSGKDKTRAKLTQEQIENNSKNYLKQIGKIIDINKSEVVYNGDWFKDFQFLDILNLTSKITIQQILERDDFTKRIKSSNPISLHECLYPLMQGYDSVKLKVDVELGGTEQLFNLLVARDLQKNAGQKPQVCITLPILIGLDGIQKMGKSLNNYIAINDSPQNQFDKIMSIPDKIMPQWYELLTNRIFNPNIHPMESKKILATDIVEFYHNFDIANKSRLEWEKKFSKREDPTDIPEILITEKNIWICKLLVMLGLAESNTKARQAIEGNAVSIGNNLIKDPKMNIEITKGLIVRNGKRKIAKVK